jgi:hypothetical protein
MYTPLVGAKSDRGAPKEVAKSPNLSFLRLLKLKCTGESEIEGGQTRITLSLSSLYIYFEMTQ